MHPEKVQELSLGSHVSGIRREIDPDWEADPETPGEIIPEIQAILLTVIEKNETFLLIFFTTRVPRVNFNIDNNTPAYCIFPDISCTPLLSWE